MCTILFLLHIRNGFLRFQQSIAKQIKTNNGIRNFPNYFNIYNSIYGNIDTYFKTNSFDNYKTSSKITLKIFGISLQRNSRQAGIWFACGPCDQVWVNKNQRKKTPGNVNPLTLQFVDITNIFSLYLIVAKNKKQKKPNNNKIKKPNGSSIQPLQNTAKRSKTIFFLPFLPLPQETPPPK